MNELFEYVSQYIAIVSIVVLTRKKDVKDYKKKQQQQNISKNHKYVCIVVGVCVNRCVSEYK